MQARICLANLCKYFVKRYVPRVWGDFLDFLAVKRDVDQLRSQPLSSMSQEVKVAVEVTAAHANAMVLIVEGNDWRDNEINRFGPLRLRLSCTLLCTDVVCSFCALFLYACFVRSFVYG